MLNGLDLFSGIGGLTVALEPWVRPVAYCESDRHAQAVLLSRMSDGALPRGPIWDDVRTLHAGLLPKIDIVYGGFPCQDISVAGAGKGLAGDRSGLYLEIERLVCEVKPTFVFLENVTAIRTRGLGRVVWGLSELGYDLRWTTVSAQEIGAPHLRQRWFLLAYAKCLGGRAHAGTQPRIPTGPKKLQQEIRETLPGDTQKGRAVLADSDSTGCEVDQGSDQGSSCGERRDAASGCGWWASEPAVGRVVDGLPLRVDRLRGLGNAVVPLQAREAFMRLMGLSGF